MALQLVEDQPVVIATGNQGKMNELRAILGDVCPLIAYSVLVPEDYRLPDEIDNTYHGNAVLKAMALAKITGMPALADDSGLEVDRFTALMKRPYPGPKYNENYGHVEPQMAYDHITLNGMHDTEATSVCVLALAFPDRGPCATIGSPVLTFEGRLRGTIVPPTGHGGFGYDSFFMPEGGYTLAQLSPEQKNKISARAKAAEAMKKALWPIT